MTNPQKISKKKQKIKVMMMKWNQKGKEAVMKVSVQKVVEFHGVSGEIKQYFAPK